MGDRKMDSFGLEAIKAWNALPRHAYQTISVRPLTSTIGAEIGGVDLSKGVTDEQLAELRVALHENMVLVFRDQHMTEQQHRAFGLKWGQLHLHPVLLAQKKPNPEILEVRNDSTSKVAIGEGWHSDATLEERPPMGSMLYMKEMPEPGYGGDTMFANMCLAYETLSPTMQKFIEGLTAVHSGEVLPRLYGFPIPEGGYPETTHPVVVRHPETGRKTLFVSPAFTVRIPELSQAESKAVLDVLFRHVETSPAICVRISWNQNDMVFWDNRCTQHHAIFDYAPHTRVGVRVTVLGERPQA